MFLFVIEKHLIWSRTNPDGGTTSFYYYDWITALVVALILLSLTLVVIGRYLLKRVIKHKRKLSRQASLVKFSPVTFDDIDRPNHIDAAIAKLWPPNPHKLVVPFVGAVKGYVKREHIELGETVCKFGRSTGRTTGHVSSICVDIWILYHRTGRSAIFEGQVLIEPDLPEFTNFARSGDSGSLVFDANQHALGLIFAGRTDSPAPRESVANVRRIQSYGVANPISEVLDLLKIELLIEDNHN